jgi:hypothetical protein
MNYFELRNLVSDIENRPSACNVRFGCDCGCGGDYYTYEQWSEGENAAEEAIKKLKQLGIGFEEYEKCC